MDVLQEVEVEINLARNRYNDMASAHEGYAIIMEEMDELWNEIKRKPGAVDKSRLKIEAIQVAAMAIRFVEDLCE